MGPASVLRLAADGYRVFAALVNNAGVMIGSIGDRVAMPFGEPLGASQAAIALMAEAPRQELVPWDVKVT